MSTELIMVLRFLVPACYRLAFSSGGNAVDRYLAAEPP
ncbi:hypothetical protein FHX15_002098 [Rhizobium sp. BK650]|nr:hypothetical protein [Rhizobium sp. BK650]